MLHERLCKTQIFHGLSTQVWSISESLMDLTQVLLDGFELSSNYIVVFILGLRFVMILFYNTKKIINPKLTNKHDSLVIAELVIWKL